MSSGPRGTASRIVEAVTGPFTLGPEYMKFWLGYGLSSVADNVAATALSIVLLQETGSAVAVSLGLLLQLLPAAIVGPFAGLVIDRLNRKSVLIVTSAVRALVTVYAAYAVRAGGFSLAQCAVWMGVTSVLKAFYDPCTGTVMPSLVKKESLHRANAMQALANNTAMILGPALAGFGLARGGGWQTMMLCTAGFGLAVVALASMSLPYEAPRPSLRPGFGEVWDGLAFYRRQPLAMYLLVMMVFINFLAVPSYTAFEVHVLQTLGLDADALGFAFSVSAVVSVAASYLVAMRRRWPHLGRMMAIGMAAMGASFVLVGASGGLSGVVWAFALFGAAGPLILIPISALFQEITPTGIRGRVFAARFVVSTLMAPLTTPVVGWGLDKFGSVPVLWILGGAMGALAMASMLVRHLREA